MKLAVASDSNSAHKYASQLLETMGLSTHNTGISMEFVLQWKFHSKVMGAGNPWVQAAHPTFLALNQ